MTLLRNESKIMLYDKKMLDRYPAKDEENLRGVRGLFFNDDASESAYHMTLLRNESKIMLYDKKMLDRYPAKDEENLRGVPMI